MTTGPQPPAVDADLVRRISICFAAAVERGRQSSPDPESGALDLAAVRAYVEELAEGEGILGSGSIHVEPAGYLCVVPDSAAAKPDRRLFLPFADDDVMTSVILSKVLLLLADHKITDPGIRAQIDAATRTA
jgi:hypothetical protein